MESKIRKKLYRKTKKEFSSAKVLKNNSFKLILGFIFFIILVSNVKASEYTSFLYPEARYKCLFNNTRIFIDVNKDGIEEYIIDCNESFSLPFEVKPRVWERNFNIKSTKPIVYHTTHGVKLFYNQRDYYPMIQKFVQEQTQYYQKMMIEAGEYFFAEQGNQIIECIDSNETIAISYNFSTIDIACDALIEPVQIISRTKQNIHSGNYFLIPEDTTYEIIGNTNLSVDIDSDNIADDYFVNPTELAFLKGYVVKSTNRVMIRPKNIHSRPYFVKPFDLINETIYCSSKPIDSIEIHKDIYQLNKSSIVNYKTAYTTLRPEVTVYSRFKDLFEKHIIIRIANPTAKFQEYTFSYAIDRPILEKIDKLYSLLDDSYIKDTENTTNNQSPLEFVMEPFSYREIDIKLPLDFSQVKVTHNFSFDEEVYD